MVQYKIEFEARTPKKGQRSMNLIGKIRETVGGEAIEFAKVPAIQIFKKGKDKWSYTVGRLGEGKFEKVGGSVPSGTEPWEENARLWNKLKSKMKEIGVTEPDKALKEIAGGLKPEHFEIEEKSMEDAEGSFDGTPHPGGGITDEVVYEPIGGGKYAYRTADGKRGIAEPGAETLEDETGKTTLHYLDFDGDLWYFGEDDEPLNTPLFDTPPIENVEEWAEGERESLSIGELWRRSLIYYRSFLDFPRDSEYSFMVLMSFQSWIVELLPVTFYLGVQAEFGGGKTVSGEAIILPCRHGVEIGSTSPSFVARGTDRQKLTIFADELDATSGEADSPIYQIFRQGYRRGAEYTRSDKDNPDVLRAWDIFGAKIYTCHSTVETALRTRTIPLHSMETQDERVPVVNVDKLPFGKSLKESFLFWWLDNAFDLKERDFEAVLPPQLDQLDGLDQVYGRDPSSKKFPKSGNFSEPPSLPYNWSSQSSRSSQAFASAEKLRDLLYERKKTVLEEGQVEKLKKAAGRNVELMYQAFALANLLNVDIDDNITAIFEQKRIEEAEEVEVGVIGILRDVLINKYEEKKLDTDYWTKDNHVKIANKEIYNDYNAEVREEGLRGVSPHKFKEYLTELGFSDATNRRKLEVKLEDKDEPQSRLCNIFDERVLRKIGVDEEEELSRSQLDKLQRVMEIIDELGEEFEEGVPIESVKDEAQADGIGSDFVDEMIEQERRNGRLHSPKEGVIMHDY